MKEIDTIGLLTAIKTAPNNSSVKLSDHRIIKTANGSRIQRDPKYGIGKRVGNKIYVHSKFALRVIRVDILMQARLRLAEFDSKHTYNIIRYNEKTNEVCFLQAADFDYADEPLVGHWCAVQPNGDCTGYFSPAVYHHKWTMVAPEYTGFDVSESMSRSEFLLKHIPETLIGGSRAAWEKQQEKWGVW